MSAGGSGGEAGAKALIEEAVRQAKQTGCELLHVDFEPHLRDFYFGACGFKATDAGLIALKQVWRCTKARA